ncbi:hypothetical protein [Nonomuraea basaltis]|uniref:hypothetical protein n=1 Tax=Nonomuraea basaltis TaxID=2495887 RepID=UPI00110C581A|nr:hypothetical protein [Nonomuraea basaltis]TMR99787.1 hypothetical protein EJK15_05845 [Nonomuraea basaltis]
MREILVSLAALLVVSGCSAAPAAETFGTSPPAPSAQPTPEDTTSPSPPPRSSATPGPRPISREQAAKRYLAIVKPYNLALERLETAINSGRPATTLRTLAARVASANETHMRGLRSVRWPSAARMPIRQLIAESARAQDSWHRAARAGARDGVIQHVLQAAKHDGSAAAGKIRRLLDLGKYDERDYA